MFNFKWTQNGWVTNGLLEQVINAMSDALHTRFTGLDDEIDELREMNRKLTNRVDQLERLSRGPYARR